MALLANGSRQRSSVDELARLAILSHAVRGKQTAVHGHTHATRHRLQRPEREANVEDCVGIAKRAGQQGTGKDHALVGLGGKCLLQGARSLLHRVRAMGDQDAVFRRFDAVAEYRCAVAFVDPTLGRAIDPRVALPVLLVLVVVVVVKTRAPRTLASCIAESIKHLNNHSWTYHP